MNKFNKGWKASKEKRDKKHLTDCFRFVKTMKKWKEQQKVCNN